MGRWPPGLKLAVTWTRNWASFICSSDLIASLNASLPVIVTSTLAMPRSSDGSAFQPSRSASRSRRLGPQERCSLLAAVIASAIAAGGRRKRGARAGLPSGAVTSQKLGTMATGSTPLGSTSCETTNQCPTSSGTVPLTSVVYVGGGSAGTGSSAPRASGGEKTHRPPQPRGAPTHGAGR